MILAKLEQAKADGTPVKLKPMALAYHTKLEGNPATVREIVTLDAPTGAGATETHVRCEIAGHVVWVYPSDVLPWAQ